MKRTLFIVIITTFLVLHTECQNFYITAGSKYHLPLTTQVAPEYFEAGMVTYSYWSPHIFQSYEDYYEIKTIRYTPVTAIIQKFSLAQGLSFGGSMGYRFNTTFGVEIGIDYFKTAQTIETEKRLNYTNSTTEWNFSSINTLPTFVVSEKYHKSAYSIKIGAIMGLSALDKTVLYNSEKMTYAFNNNISLGYLLAFEYNYQISSSLSFVAECGVDNYFYTPRKAALQESSLTRYEEETADLRLPESVQTIEYEKEIKDVKGQYDFQSKYGFSYDHYQEMSMNPDKPVKRLTETLKLNSVCFGIGLKYQFKAHGKD